MMWSFWIGMAVITAGVALMLIRPLLRPAPAQATRRDCDLAVYRAQLAEVDQDLARGVLDAAGAEALRAEVSRRLLSLPEGEALAVTSASPRLALGLVVVLPLTALVLYLILGRPDLPALPYSARQTEIAMAERMEKIEENIATLAQRLQGEPDNLEGWRFLARSLQTLGRHKEAVTAWRRVVALSPATPDDQGALAEAMVLADQGAVGPEARAVLEKIIAQTPDNPRAAHYLAEARAQAGDLEGAITQWAALIRRTPADAPWLPLVRESLIAAARRLGKDPAPLIPAPLPAIGPDTAAAGRDGAAPPGADPPTPEQKDILRKGVEALKAKLEADPQDIDGWIYLARAHAVLEALSEAAAALKKALALAPDNLQALWLLGGVEQETGHPEEARRHWQRLLGHLSPGTAEHEEVAKRLRSLDGK